VAVAEPVRTIHMPLLVPAWRSGRDAARPLGLEPSSPALACRDSVGV